MFSAWSDDNHHGSAVLPRSIMLPGFILIFLSYIGSFCGLLTKEYIVLINCCAVMEFIGGKH